MKMTGLSAPNILDIWHDWYRNAKRTPEEQARVDEGKVGADTAPLLTKIAVRDGNAPLPGGSRVWFDVDPHFDPPVRNREQAGDAFVPWPEWKIALVKDGQTIRSTILGEDHYAEDGFCALQSPEREGGKYRNSMGYAPIIEFDTAPERCELHITVAVGGFESTLVIPWMAGPGDQA